MFNQSQFNAALDQKYRNQTVATNAQANLQNTQAALAPSEAAARNAQLRSQTALTGAQATAYPAESAARQNLLGSQANLAGAQATAYPAESAARQGLLGSQTALTGAQATAYPAESAARQGLLGSQTALTGAQASQVAPSAESERSLNTARVGELNAQARATLLDVSPVPQGAQDMFYNNIRSDPLGVYSGGGSTDSYSASPIRYAHGTAHVPAKPAAKGKGKGMVTQGTDTVPAMLTPDEAVLNKHGADIIGRDKIAAANLLGDHIAQQSEAQAGKPASGKGMTPANGQVRPTPSQRLAKGTHQVMHGKSAKTPGKLDPAAVLALLGSAGGGAPMPQPQSGGMV